MGKESGEVIDMGGLDNINMSRIAEAETPPPWQHLECLNFTFLIRLHFFKECSGFIETGPRLTAG